MVDIHYMLLFNENIKNTDEVVSEIFSFENYIVGVITLELPTLKHTLFCVSMF